MADLEVWEKFAADPAVSATLIGPRDSGRKGRSAPPVIASSSHRIEKHSGNIPKRFMRSQNACLRRRKRSIDLIRNAMFLDLDGNH